MARYFNGISDYATVPNNASLSNLNSFTVWFWLKARSDNLNGYILYKGSGFVIHIAENNGLTFFRYTANTNYVTDSNFATPDVWKFYAITYNRSNLDQRARIYGGTTIENFEEARYITATRGNDGAGDDSFDGWCIGANNTFLTNFFKGDIAYIGLTTNILDVDQMKEIMADPVGSTHVTSANFAYHCNQPDTWEDLTANNFDARVIGTTESDSELIIPTPKKAGSVKAYNKIPSFPTIPDIS